MIEILIPGRSASLREIVNYVNIAIGTKYPGCLYRYTVEELMEQFQITESEFEDYILINYYFHVGGGHSIALSPFFHESADFISLRLKAPVSLQINGDELSIGSVGNNVAATTAAELHPIVFHYLLKRAVREGLGWYVHGKDLWSPLFHENEYAVDIFHPRWHRFVSSELFNLYIVCREVDCIVNLPITEMLKARGYSLARLSDEMIVPYRTVQQWTKSCKLHNRISIARHLGFIPADYNSDFFTRIKRMSGGIDICVF